MREYRFTTPHGIQVTRTLSKANYRRGLKHLLRDLDRHRGIYLSSGYEYPGRYSRWDIASTCPPLEIISYDRRMELRPLDLIEMGTADYDITAYQPVLYRAESLDEVREVVGGFFRTCTDDSIAELRALAGSAIAG